MEEWDQNVPNPPKKEKDDITYLTVTTLFLFYFSLIIYRHNIFPITVSFFPFSLSSLAFDSHRMSVYFFFFFFGVFLLGLLLLFNDLLSLLFLSVFLIITPPRWYNSISKEAFFFFFFLYKFFKFSSPKLSNFSLLQTSSFYL